MKIGYSMINARAETVAL
ncbi:MAG: hypothetical protein PHG00_17715, partial [Methylococcales bacterium]|nr:hypothetical protein [Methylococcales bacterium]